MRGGRHPGLPLARRRVAVAEEKAPQEAVRDPADHTGISGVSDDQQTYGDPVTVRGPSIHRH